MAKFRKLVPTFYRSACILRKLANRNIDIEIYENSLEAY